MRATLSDGNLILYASPDVLSSLQVHESSWVDKPAHSGPFACNLLPKSSRVSSFGQVLPASRQQVLCSAWTCRPLFLFYKWFRGLLEIRALHERYYRIDNNKNEDTQLNIVLMKNSRFRPINIGSSSLKAPLMYRNKHAFTLW